MTYIFLGPTLPVEEAEKVLKAHYLPPARQGDILTLVEEKKPKIIGLIDGYFTQTLSVWHKEILYALENNVAVLGASSMGALRAAETAPFGMVGVGKIYEMYQAGFLTDDDEVALIHGGKESGYFNLSLPMVNIRMTLQEAAMKGVISTQLSEEWIALAKSLYYPQRSLENMAESGSLTPDKKELLETIFSDHYIDQKKEDALSLLTRISSWVPVEQLPGEHLHKTPMFQELFHKDRSVFSHNTLISQGEIVKYSALNHPAFSQLKMHALNRILAGVLASVFSIQVESKEILQEKERFLLQNSLGFPGDFERWLEENHLSETAFEELMKERATIRTLYSSPLVSRSVGGLTKAILDELKFSQQYPTWLAKAAEQKEALKKTDPFYFETEKEEKLIEEHLEKSGWDLDVPVKQWCAESGFLNLQELILELHQAKIVRDL